MITLISAVVIFCVIIFIHEFGHFITAKAFGMTIHEFSIGMGPKLCSFSRGGTAYSVRAFPLGGFVRLEGEDGESDDRNAFCNKTGLERFTVLFAGAFMNFLLGFLIYIVIMASGNGLASNKVGNISENSAFSEAGIESGDEIIRMSGESYKCRIRTYNDIVYFNYKNGNGSAEITFDRDGEIFTKQISPKYSEIYGRYMFGFSAYIEPKSFFGVIKYSFLQSIYVIKVVLLSFADLIRGTVPVSDISGPVGIVGEIGNAAKSGIMSLFSLAALISINLGVVNLLPIPALDGGRLLFIIIEFIRRKPVPPDKEAMVHAVGFAILIALMLIVTFFDVSKLI